MGRVTVVGLGQGAAGDDGVGPAVIERLRAEGVGADVDLVTVRDASDLVALLLDGRSAIVVDALVAPGPPGDVSILAAEQLCAEALCSVSSHGIGAVQAVELARALQSGPSRAPHVSFVGVTIAVAHRFTQGLSEPIAAAVPRAVHAVRRLLDAEG